jgi:hypothetical protein
VDLEAIKLEYLHLRTTGMDARSTLAILRPEIVRLESRQREHLLEQLRGWEIHRTATGSFPPEATNGAASPPPDADPPPRPAPPMPGKPPKIKPLASNGASSAGNGETTCPHCGKPNRFDDIFCGACGEFLTLERGQHDTHRFVDEYEGQSSDAYFGPDSTLLLMVKDTQETFRIRPQDQPHEVIVGRGAGSSMRPDIDLGPQQGALLGVSRLHLSITYNEKHHTLSAVDIGSANGTAINGMRLRPEEVRVLRHGDELRLGKLVLAVYFYREER